MDIEKASEFAQHWIGSWNSHNLEEILEHYAEDLEFTSPLVKERFPDQNGTISNKGKLREYFSIGLKTNPSLSFNLLEVLVGVNELILYYENARGGRTAETFRFNDIGKIVEVHSCYSS